jgi:hypothetical protein
MIETRLKYITIELGEITFNHQLFQKGQTLN